MSGSRGVIAKTCYNRVNMDLFLKRRSNKSWREFHQQ